ncbi:MAG: hydroxymyristoyl-ACP dehydratase [Bacteroidia bacterium]|nr:MAG: hydroxymyristoyl-ACP dehydratase [Bacteroidia bacterium]
MFVDKFYTIREMNAEGEKVIANIELNPQHPIYKGHFPQQAVVPGVMTLLMVREIAEIFLQKELQLSSSKNIKFTSPILPDVTKFLQIALTFRNNNQKGEWITDTEVLSDTNKICLKASLIFSEIS